MIIISHKHVNHKNVKNPTLQKSRERNNYSEKEDYSSLLSLLFATDTGYACVFFNRDIKLPIYIAFFRVCIYFQTNILIKRGVTAMIRWNDRFIYCVFNFILILSEQNLKKIGLNYCSIILITKTDWSGKKGIKRP